MPKVGEIRNAREIGYCGDNKRIWHLCIDCGKGRWVKLLRGAAPNLRCQHCNAIKHLTHGRPRLYTDEERLAKRHLTGAKNRAKLKKEILTHYSPDGKIQCTMCGIEDELVLCVDHINGGGKKHIKELQKQGTTFYQWLRNNNFPEGFQILCANCNLRKSILHERNKLWQKYL